MFARGPVVSRQQRGDTRAMRRSLVLLCGLALCAACGPTSDPARPARRRRPAGRDATSRPGTAPSPTRACARTWSTSSSCSTSRARWSSCSTSSRPRSTSVVTAATALAPEPHFGLIAFVDNFKLDDTGPARGGRGPHRGRHAEGRLPLLQEHVHHPEPQPGRRPHGPDDAEPHLRGERARRALRRGHDLPVARRTPRASSSSSPTTPSSSGRTTTATATATASPTRPTSRARGTTRRCARMAETVDALRNNGGRASSRSPASSRRAARSTQCGTGRRLPWAAVSDGWSTPYKGQEPIPARTDGRNFDIDQVKAGRSRSRPPSTRWCSRATATRRSSNQAPARSRPAGYADHRRRPRRAPLPRMPVDQCGAVTSATGRHLCLLDVPAVQAHTEGMQYTIRGVKGGGPGAA